MSSSMFLRQTTARIIPATVATGMAKATAEPPAFTSGLTITVTAAAMATVSTHLKVNSFGFSLFAMVRMKNQPMKPMMRTSSSPSKANFRRWPKVIANITSLLPDDTVGLAGAADGGVVGDEAFTVEVVEAIIHEDHALLAAHLNGVLHLMELVFADEIADGAVGDEQFIGEDAAGAVGGGKQFLRDDSLEGIGELHHDLALGIAVEDADDAFDGLRHAGGMHGGEHEVAGFRGGQRG